MIWILTCHWGIVSWSWLMVPFNGLGCCAASMAGARKIKRRFLRISTCRLMRCPIWEAGKPTPVFYGTSFWQLKKCVRNRLSNLAVARLPLWQRALCSCLAVASLSVMISMPRLPQPRKTGSTTTTWRSKFVMHHWARRQQDGQVIGISCPTSQQKLTYLSSTDRHGRFIRMCAVRQLACFRASVPVAGFC